MDDYPVSDYIAQFHRRDVARVIDAYVKDFPCYCQIYDSADDTIPETSDDIDRIETAVCTLESVLGENGENILRAISGDIIRYMRHYNVRAREGVDEFKLVYFTGRALSRFLGRAGDGYASQVVQYANVIMRLDSQ